MKKPLLAAAAFAVCALVFLIYSWVAYAGARGRAEDDRIDWENSRLARQEFAKVRRELEAADVADVPSIVPNVPDVMGKLRDECGIDTSQMEIRGTGAGAAEQTAHNVRFEDVRVDVMGVLLHKLRQSFKYMVVREITMQTGRSGEPGTFTWTLVVAIPKPLKSVSYTHLRAHET